MKAAECQDTAIRDAFIAGMHSANIRQRLLEGSDLKLTSVYDKARSLDDAQRNAGAYAPNASFPSVAIARPDGKEYPADSRRCSHCGDGPHDRQHCPANGRTCYITVVKRGIFHGFARRLDGSKQQRYAITKDWHL